MSWISHSLDVDQLYYGYPFTIPQQEESPLPQNFLSPLVLDENQLFSVPLTADECRQAHGGGISDMTLPRVNINMSTASSEIHQHSSRPNYLVSSESKKSSSNKGSMARRSGKKDRHTKINTANGLRDRRMRLSLQIARKFFDLQDKLGYDKASKTIEWLFSKSKKAINQLSSNATQMNNNNVYQKGSKSVEISEEQRKFKTTSDDGECVSGTKKTRKSATRSTKHNAKDLRDQARARARERTRDKKNIKCLERSKWSLSDQTNFNLTQLGPAGNPNPLFEIGQESMSNTSSQENICTSQSSIHHHLANMELLGAIASPSGSVSCSMYGYDHENNGSSDLFYLGWDIISSEFLNPNSTGFL